MDVRTTSRLLRERSGEAGDVEVGVVVLSDIVERFEDGLLRHRLVVRRVGRGRRGRGIGHLEEIQDLVCAERIEIRILLRHDCRSDVELEALKTVIRSRISQSRRRQGRAAGTHPMIFSSSVPRMMSRYTLTTFFWPSRCARSMAWRSFMGFQSCSTKMTVSAPVKFSPRPPTWVVKRRQSMEGSELKVWQIACRFETSVVPSSRMYVTSGMSARKRSFSTMSSIVFNWQKIRARCCGIPASVPTESPPLEAPEAPIPQSSRICLRTGRSARAYTVQLGASRHSL